MTRIHRYNTKKTGLGWRSAFLIDWIECGSIGGQKSRGPKPMQLVVVMAVRKAVSAATITFTATSTIRFFMRHLPSG